MIRSLLAGAALAAIALPTPASASIMFDISGTFVDGGTFSGTLTTSNNLATLEGFSLTTTPGNGWPYPNFAGATYDMAGATTLLAWLPTNWMQAWYPNGSQLNLYFASALTTSGTTFANSANEYVSSIGSRWITSGGMTARVTAAVPEPGTWALMILGFGLVGGAMRASRRQKVTVTYA